jgi:outer membrane protein OmpA-like peptidoglycan-associated protein
VGVGNGLVLSGLLIAVMTASQGWCAEVCNDEFGQNFGDTVAGMSNDAFLIEEGCRTDKLKRLTRAVGAIRVFPKSGNGHDGHGEAQPNFANNLTGNGEKKSGRPIYIASSVEPATVETILFDFNSSRIRRDESKHLDEMASRLKQDGKQVSLLGYTCDIGTERYNQRLSESRANSVASFLRSKGVEIGRVEGKGACCAVSDEKPRNRRVEINTRLKEQP